MSPKEILKLDERDLRVDSYSNGLGRTPWSRVTHLPTGICVEKNDPKKTNWQNRRDAIEELERLVHDHR